MALPAKTFFSLHLIVRWFETSCSVGAGPSSIISRPIGTTPSTMQLTARRISPYEFSYSPRNRLLPHLLCIPPLLLQNKKCHSRCPLSPFFLPPFHSDALSTLLMHDHQEEFHRGELVAAFRLSRTFFQLANCSFRAPETKANGTPNHSGPRPDVVSASNTALWFCCT